MDQVRTLNFMNNAAFLSLGKEYLNLEEKLHWTCMLLFLCNIHKSLTFSSRFQRQKIVFADSLLFSLLVAAGSLGLADKLGALPASRSEHPFPSLLLQGVALLLACPGGQREGTSDTTLGGSRSHQHLSNRARANISVGEICCSGSCM